MQVSAGAVGAEEELVVPAEWMRVLHPRRGGSQASAIEVPAHTGSASPLEELLAAVATAATVIMENSGSEPDLVEALKAREIAGAAMDVYSVEPLPPDSALLTLDNLVVTPHLAAMAADNFAPTVKRMFANMVHVSRGEPVPERDMVV